MSRESTIHIELRCPSCDGAHFEVRILLDNGLASAHCAGCARNYLLLDSEDYWFDAIQETYPRPRRCSCKTAIFTLRCDYRLRDNGEVETCDIWTMCLACRKSKRQLRVEIDYDGTNDLVSQPLRYCETTYLRYDLKNLSLLLTEADMVSIVDHLHTELQCSFVCWLWKDDHWIATALGAADLRKIIHSHDYLYIYATLLPLDAAALHFDKAKAEESFWKQHEVIRLSSPDDMLQIGGIGYCYNIQYANEFVEHYTVTQKSDEFRAATESFLQWLGTRFVSRRGKHTFDSPSEHRRLFGG